ncbi:adenylate cyclase associated C terminal-domain-containing protein [Russula vinacea]|nr:adenylate cyclase associated C terminal-domain-containing protein [Russula vinacea]
MSSINMSTVLKRLEAVTSRLEDLYEHSGKGAPQSSSAPTPASTITSAAVTAPVPQPAPVRNQVTVDPPSVVAYYEQILKGRVQPFVELTGSFTNSSIVEQAKLVEQLYTHLGGIIRIAAICKKPDQAAFAELLSDLQSDIEAITAIKDSNGKDRVWLNHLTLVADGSPVVAWITVVLLLSGAVSQLSGAHNDATGKQARSIRDGNKGHSSILWESYHKEFKEKWVDMNPPVYLYLLFLGRDKTHVEWVKAFTAIFDDMKKYVMEHHTTGLVWNAKGISISEYKAAAPAADGAPPPPPPPPPPGPPPPPTLPHPPPQLLREMTHKNPALRASSTVPSSVGTSAAPKKPVRPAKPHALMGKKPAKFALEGNKWAIEYQENEAALTVDKTEISHIVNLFGCKNSTIVIKGKVNAVTIFNCTKTSVLVESVISSVSVTNSPSVTLQITGSAPTIQLDSTDSGQIYLSKDCLGTEITTAKCSSINISLPVEGEEDGIFDEKPLPEMLLTKIVDGKLVTTVVEHVG